MAQGRIAIRYGRNARAADLSDYSLQVLHDILKAAGLDKALISSTARTPEDQARVMYENLVARGIAHQKRLYAAAGDEVIDVYAAAKAAGKSPAEIQRDMVVKIMALGPARVSRHAADPRVLNVFDIAPSSIRNKSAFEAAVAADMRVTKFLQPPDDPGYHLEIPQTRELTIEREAAASVSPPGRYIVTARSGLNLRGSPTLGASVLRTCARGTEVTVLSAEDAWAAVDLSGDGLVDGYMALEHLAPQAPQEPRNENDAVQPVSSRGDLLSRVGVDHVARMFPATRKSNIEANLPFVLSGLRACGLVDRPMILMALATIRAESEGFVPVSEHPSRYNTLHAPFDLYDAGTPKGRDLGNVRPGDGPTFRGRGYVQLTGRENYTRIGAQLGIDLAGDPERANEPECAGLVLAQFLKNREAAIRSALERGLLLRVRQLVNGGRHGFERFHDAYDRGFDVLPS